MNRDDMRPRITVTRIYGSWPLRYKWELGSGYGHNSGHAFFFRRAVATAKRCSRVRPIEIRL